MWIKEQNGKSILNTENYDRIANSQENEGAYFLWNGRGVTRTKTGNQTGDCPVQDSAEIKAFKVLWRLISAAFFSKKIKETG